MDHDKSWTNPSFEPDDVTGEPRSLETYQIPRVAVNRRPSSHKDNYTNKLPNFPVTSIPLESADSFIDCDAPGGKKGNYAVSNNTDEEDNIDLNDYSLLSYFRNWSSYMSLQEKYKTIEKKIDLKYLRSLFWKIFFLLLFLAYFISVLVISPNKTSLAERLNITDNADNADELNNYYWCNDVGFLILITAFAGILLIYFQILKPIFSKPPVQKLVRSCVNNEKYKKVARGLNYQYVHVLLYVCVFLAILIFLIIDSHDDRSRLRSLGGVVFIIAFGFIFSVAPRKVIWRQVLWGLGLQFAMGLMILRWPTGANFFDCLGSKVNSFLAFTDQGSGFIYKDLVKVMEIFAFKVLSVIFFFSFCIQILYYYGIMQWVVIKLGWVLQVSIGTTACESVNAAANIFLGMSEAPLLIKPFLSKLTKSELHAVMTGGFATVAGSVMAAYISFGVNSAHLLTASVMSAPAALGFAKLFYPEVEISQTLAKDIQIGKRTEANPIHAACEGVVAAVPLVANIIANLIGFIAFIAFVDGVLNWTCVLINIENDVCSVSNLFGYIFTPLAWILGVPWEDCYFVGQLIGIKTILNEFVAYEKLVEYTKAGFITKRSEIIATYALCGFSNVGSIGIQIGALGSLAPDRKKDLATMALRAMIAGTAACLLTACVAGSLISASENTTTAVDNLL